MTRPQPGQLAAKVDALRATGYAVWTRPEPRHRAPYDADAEQQDRRMAEHLARGCVLCTRYNRPRHRAERTTP